MAPSIPYTYIQCSCSDQAPVDGDSGVPDDNLDYDDDRTFDPRNPRSNYSLYPLEYLLYCEDCQQIRCPRCIAEETVTYFCPNCLFEVPSSNLRSEGNRCTRSCYQCPVCVGPLQVVQSQNSVDTSRLTVEGQGPAPASSFELVCQYCSWCSSEIGVEFERPSGIHSQLAKLNNGGSQKLTIKDIKDRRKDTQDDTPLPDELMDTDLQFASLKSFYQTQLADMTTTLGGIPLHDGFSSPAALTRIMSLYTGRVQQNKLQSGVPNVMREALNTDEGLKLVQLDESAAIKKLTTGGWDGTTSLDQQQFQPEPSRFQDALRPIPYLLRTKRSKRCPACRHILSKPENKVTSTRFKIRLVAKSYIPTITVRPMNPVSTPVPVTSRPGAAEEPPLTPLKPYQYILTLKNPLFEKIKVSLATPNVTPGRFASKVTVLCPQFEIDANTDMWDDALKDDGRDRTRKEESSGQAEAGKIWERGRNWVSIVLEVIPASLRVDQLRLLPGADTVDDSPLKDDEDILEIPMFVRMEWEADGQGELGTAPGRDKDGREKRELAYWCVLGVGRVAKD